MLEILKYLRGLLRFHAKTSTWILKTQRLKTLFFENGSRGGKI